MRRGRVKVGLVLAGGLMAVLGSSGAVHAAPGDPSPGWPADGVADWQGNSVHAEVEVLADGTVVMAFRDDEGAFGLDNTRVRLFTRGYGFLGETVIEVVDDSTDLADLDAWGNSAFVVVNQMNEGQATIEVRRFTTSGLDESWGDNGVVSFGTGPELRRARAAAASPDGGVFVFAARRLYKFDSTGQLDMSFSDDGQAPVKLLSDTAVVDIDIDAQGRIAVLGNRCQASCRGAVTRISSAGRTVRTFGSKGVKHLKHPAAEKMALESVAWTSDGKLVVGGVRYPNGLMTAVRLSGATGAIDLSFGGNGWASFRMNANGSYTGRAAVQSNGRVVVVGGYKKRWTIVRFRANGTRDDSFGSNGVIDMQVGDEFPTFATDVALDNLGKRIVVVGREKDRDLDEFDRFVAVGSFRMN